LRASDLRCDDTSCKCHNFVESAAEIDASGDPIATRRFDDFIREANIVLEPVTEIQSHIARAAYRDFGRHSARLNFGDCFAYALAKESREPLLFKGDDFAHTDTVAALPTKPWGRQGLADWATLFDREKLHPAS
jgi:ribonuclease VapC